MANWEESVLGDYVTHRKGFAFKSQWFIDEGVPVVKVTDFTDSSVDAKSVEFVEEKIAEDKKQYKLNMGDTVIQTVGSWPNNPASVVGKAIKVPRELHGALLNQNAVILRPKKGMDRDYLFYLLKSNMFKGFIINTAQGADNQASITLDSIFRFPFYKPPVTEQRKIAALLLAYDDLIENNKRRIALLEKMAEDIYREWFVRFRFPGYQTAEFEKGIPKDWEVVELKEIAKENSKSTKPGTHLEDRYYLPLDIMGSEQFLPLDHYPYTDAQSSLVTFEKDEFIFGAMRPYQHKVVIAPFNGITRTTCFVIKPREEWLYSFLYLTLFKKSTIDYAMLISNGSDRPYTVWNRGMERMGVLRPDKDTLIAFEKAVRPILGSVVSYYFVQRKLNETKDMLLPRLISGKLSVADLDIQFPPSMSED